MLANGNVMAVVAVKDLNSAKQFYGSTLGLPQVSENPGGVTYKSGNGSLFVYQSDYAGTNQANTAAWDVADVAAEVEELKAKGVTFEHYDMPGATLEGDVHVMGDMKSAWFKDPDGNIFCISTEH
jgi:catechol 2,3-dioxygenase-like lactoylglutathione lyase family enzyme